MHVSLSDPRARRWKSTLAIVTSAGVVVAASAIAHPGAASAQETHHATPAHHGHHHAPRNRTIGRYAQTNLVSDQAGAAQLQDPNLINPWGLAFGPTTEAWTANFATNTSTLYEGGVNSSPVVRDDLVVSVPGLPTGQVFNGGPGFKVSGGGATDSARFIFDTASGTIVGWSPNVPAAVSSDGQVAVTVPGAEFFGLAIDRAENRLYAADFRNNKVDVFDDSFKQVSTPGAFTDPKLPSGYSPFGIEDVNGTVVVTYALLDPATGIDVPGTGHGVVDAYSESGKLERRIATGGTLSSPWGVALAPKGFGAASGDLLIGNLGDGKVNAFDPRSGTFEGQLADVNGNAIANDGLWALKFGNGRIGATNQLLFTAGPTQYMHGLFGELTATDKHGKPVDAQAATASARGTGTHTGTTS